MQASGIKSHLDGKVTLREETLLEVEEARASKQHSKREKGTRNGWMTLLIVTVPSCGAVAMGNRALPRCRP